MGGEERLPWSDDRLDGEALCRHLAEPPPERPMRPHGALGRSGGRAAWLATSVAVLMASVAVAQGGSGGGDGATSAGNSRGEPVEIQVRNRSRGETGLVTSSDSYSLRLSNTKENGGGGAVYGCRTAAAQPADDRACLYADNLRGGEAFLFRSREGLKVGHFDLGNPAGAPFSTNATGMVANLNADRVDNLHASEIIGQARAKAGLAAETADTATNAATATNATQLGGLGPAAYRTKAASDVDGTIVALTGVPHEGLSATITTEVPSLIFGTASFEIDSNGGSDDRIFCRMSRDAFANIISHEYNGDIPEGTFDRTFYSISGATSQPAGTYAIKLFCGEATGDTTWVAGNLVVWAVPQ